jgi:carboxylate-amine ligase
VLDELGSREAVDHIRWILEHGTGADRQLKAYAASNGDMRAVMDLMLEETKAGL